MLLCSSQSFQQQLKICKHGHETANIGHTAKNNSMDVFLENILTVSVSYQNYEELIAVKNYFINIIQIITELILKDMWMQLFPVQVQFKPFK